MAHFFNQRKLSALCKDQRVLLGKNLVVTVIAYDRGFFSPNTSIWFR